MTKFVLRTTDAAWIKRNNGTVDNDGKVAVEVDTVEPVKFAGGDWIRHRFTDVPRDAANGSIMCPASWIA